MNGDPEVLGAARTAIYGLISERIAAGSPGDWMRFEADVNAVFDRLDTARDSRPVGEDGLIRSMEAFAAARERDVRANRDAPDNINAIVAAAVRGWISRLQAGPAAVRPATEDGLDTAATSETITAQGLAANRIDSLSPDGEELGPPAVGRTDSRRA